MSVFDSDGHVQLTSHTKMFEVLEELGDRTLYPACYRGNVTLNEDNSWHLEVNKQGVHIALVDKAVVGDHLALVLGKLLHLTDAEYQLEQGGA